MTPNRPTPRRVRGAHCFGEDDVVKILSPTPRLPFTADALRRWLRRELAAGPQLVDDLAERLAHERGIDLDAAHELIVVGFDDDGGLSFVGPEQDSVMLTHHLVVGVTFTHRITEEEAAAGVVTAFPDFVIPLAMGLPDDGSSADLERRASLVGPAGVRWAERALPDDLIPAEQMGSTGVLNRTIVGPKGWLHDATDGHLMLTGTAAGWSVQVEGPSSPPAFDTVLRASLDDALRTVTGEGQDLLADLVLDAIGSVVGSDVTGRTGAIAPIGDIARSVGRSIHLNQVGGPDIDWKAHDRQRMHNMFANIWSVRPAVAVAMTSVLDIVNTVRRGSPLSEEGRDTLIANLGVGGTVEGLAQNVLRSFRRAALDGRDPQDETDDLFEAIATILDEAAKQTKATTRGRIDWLASRLAPDVVAAKALLQSALTNAPRFLPIHDDLLWFAAVNAFDAAGRAALDGALQGWVSAGGVSKAIIESRAEPSPRQILRFACSVVGRGTVRNSGPSVGRNDPCPCGSGRKYKQCHNGRPIEGDDGSPVSNAALRAMVPWLQALQLLWFERTNQRYFDELVEELDAVPEGEQRNLITTFVMDADVSDPTRTEDFLATVLGDGARWPNGLAAIVRSWADQPFALYEVEDRVMGQKLWVRDLRTGERSVVEGPETSRSYGVGAMFLARLVANGEALQLSFGCITISLGNRERALAMLDASNGRPAAFTLAQFVGGGDRVRSGSEDRAMRNTDSDEIVIHRSLLQTAHADTVEAVGAAFAALENLEQVERADDDRVDRWHLVGDGGLGKTIRGAIQVGTSTDGVWLVVETNSVRRHAESLALLRGVLGGFVELDATIDDLDDRELAEDFAEFGLDVPDMTPLGMRGGSAELTPDVMTEIALQMEERWMSESVPALGGLTPRQAADDPTRRGDLVALLSSFPPGVPGMITFDPTRLATALGVDLR